jgi:hypothetical protein
MRTINETLNPSASLLGHWYMWMNDVQGQLDRINISRKRPISVEFTPSEFTSTNGHTWDCQHLSTSLEYVGYGSDESEILTVCDTCSAQLINEEWRHDI